MKKKIARICMFLLLIVSVTGVILLMSFSSYRQKNQACKNIEVHIDQSQGILFLDDVDVKEIIVNALGDSITGDKISAIQLQHVEEILEKNSFVQDAETYLDMLGTLQIQIVQKQPVVRVINKFGVHYYLTESGVKFPLNNKFTCRVPVLSGNIDEGLNTNEPISTKTMKDAFRIIEFLRSSELWNAQVEQVYVNEKKEFEIVPMLGNFTVEFGDAENIVEKFSNLELFYKEGLMYAGWEKYKTVNVSILNQVYCTKKDTL